MLAEEAIKKAIDDVKGKKENTEANKIPDK